MPVKKWSKEVTEHSNAMDLEENIFESDDPLKIAKSLKASAETSKRRKSPPYKSAINMLTFYINRAGKNLPEKQQQVLEDAKQELRKLFGREENSTTPPTTKKAKTVTKVKAAKKAKAVSKKKKAK